MQRCCLRCGAPGGAEPEPFPAEEQPQGRARRRTRLVEAREGPQPCTASAVRAPARPESCGRWRDCALLPGRGLVAGAAAREDAGMSDARHSEAAFETVIEAYLLQNGYVSVDRDGF